MYVVSVDGGCRWVEQKGASPLYAASFKGHDDIVKVLIENGATVDQAKVRTLGMPV